MGWGILVKIKVFEYKDNFIINATVLANNCEKKIKQYSSQLSCQQDVLSLESFFVGNGLILLSFRVAGAPAA